MYELQWLCVRMCVCLQICSNGSSKEGGGDGICSSRGASSCKYCIGRNGLHFNQAHLRPREGLRISSAVIGKQEKNWHKNRTFNNLLVWDKYFTRSVTVMQAGHTILTWDMTFKKPLGIKEAFCWGEMGFCCTTTQKPWVCALNYSAC